MRNLLEELPDQVFLMVKKEDLIAFADYIIQKYRQGMKSDGVNDTIVRTNVLDLEGAVQLTHLSKSRIYKLTSEGLIPHFKRGKRLYFKKDELEEWLTEERGYYLKDIEKQASDYVLKNTWKK